MVIKSDNKTKIYITSDFHFGHDKNFLYGPRGFDNIYDHDKTIILNWNNIISEEDIVIVLGDLMLGDNNYGKSCFNQLKGRKFIIIGNHDTENRIEEYSQMRGVEYVGYGAYLKDKKFRFYLSHFATITGHVGDKPYKNLLWNLCGHMHTKDKFYEMNQGLASYHVELDAHNLIPVSLETIENDIQEFTKNIETKEKL